MVVSDPSVLATVKTAGLEVATLMGPHAVGVPTEMHSWSPTSDSRTVVPLTMISRLVALSPACAARRKTAKWVSRTLCAACATAGDTFRIASGTEIAGPGGGSGL